ncbi:MAG: hypothetical protein WCT32_04330 [Patescibacteria group bacterium]|jgi:hypothetical protein
MVRKKGDDERNMSVKEAGRKGGEKVRQWIEEGKRQEQEGRRNKRK